MNLKPTLTELSNAYGSGHAIRDMDAPTKRALTEAISQWLDSDPGNLNPSEARFVSAYPFLYDELLMPQRDVG